MIPTKSNLIYFASGCIIALLLFAKFWPKPEPEIKIVEKIVEVEAKRVAKKSTAKLFPDGTFEIVEEEISDFLKQRVAEKKQEIVPAKVGPTHIFNLHFLNGVSGGQYTYHFGNFNGGVGYKDGLYLTAGVGF